MGRKNEYPGLYFREDRGLYFARKYIPGGKPVVENLNTSDKDVAIDRWRIFMARFPNADRTKWKEVDRKLTFSQAAAVFRNRHLGNNPDLSPRSVERYETSLRYLEKHFGTMNMVDIDGPAVASFYTARRDMRSRKGGKTKAISIRRDLSCMSVMYSILAEQGHLYLNPVDAFLGSSKKGGKRRQFKTQARTRYLTRAEEKALLDRLIEKRDAATNGRDRAAYDRMRIAIILSIETGLRVGELLSAKWSHIRHDQRRIFVPAGETNHDKDGEVPLTARAYKALLELDTQSQGPYLFPGRVPGTHLTSVENPFEVLKNEVNLKDIVWHDFRRTCGCRLLQEHGAAMIEVSKWLRHSSVAVTEKHYAFLNVKALDIVAQRIDELAARV